MLQIPNDVMQEFQPKLKKAFVEKMKKKKGERVSRILILIAMCKIYNREEQEKVWIAILRHNVEYKIIQSKAVELLYSFVSVCCINIGLLFEESINYSEFMTVWFGLVWFGLVWFDLVWFGLMSDTLHFKYKILALMLMPSSKLKRENCIGEIRGARDRENGYKSRTLLLCETTIGKL
ncbi:hypothetical protein WN51_02773 [Melipona quadrifasciata]|uniref:Uncharacterized protein n=1 Tax=Melipona quadrifasciata TaxID=166423 RepID=A0A0M9A8Q3_9HYME|nr:hypothetical protein WN51_02773 [Melipona quadrifasciata]